MPWVIHDEIYTKRFCNFVSKQPQNLKRVDDYFEVYSLHLFPEVSTLYNSVPIIPTKTEKKFINWSLDLTLIMYSKGLATLKVRVFHGNSHLCLFLRCQ